MVCAAETCNGCGIAQDDHINIWELLSLMVATSAKLSMRTKLCFFFRMWDVDQDRKLHVAEMACLIRCFVYSLANYCHCERSLVPEPHKIRKYVERTFKTKTSEDVFIAWATRHKLLRSTLLLFTPAQGSVADTLEFSLTGPKMNTLIEGKRNAQSFAAKKSPKISVTAPDQGQEERSPLVKSALSSTVKLPDVAGKAKGKVTNFAMPTVGEAEDEAAEEDKDTEDADIKALPHIKEKFLFVDNAPVNLQSQSALLGRIRLLEAAASSGDSKHQCQLHGGDNEMQCLQLSKSEVLLASRLLQFLKENRDLELDAVKNLLDCLQEEVSTHPSILVQCEHRNIFRLMDADTNRFVKDALRRIRKGLRLTFLEFLEAVIPCASDARLRLYDFWHLQLHWYQEEISLKVIKAWRKEFEATKDASEIKILREDLALSDGKASDMVLTVDDLVKAGVVTSEVAQEVMLSRHIQSTTELNENEFTKIFIQGGSGRKSSNFEELMRKKFGRLAANLQKCRTISKEAGRRRSVSKESEFTEEGGFPLEELIGNNVLSEAFDFEASFEEKYHHHTE
jgi:hypothetical protein